MKRYILHNSLDLASFTAGALTKINKYLNKPNAKPLVLTCEELVPKGTENQLRAYWRLIEACRYFINAQGNNFTKEDVSEILLQRAGHFKEYEGLRKARSISLKSDTTKEDMTHILESILLFGVEFEIEGCSLVQDEWDSLLKNYGERGSVSTLPTEQEGENKKEERIDETKDEVVA
jgi:hypothetical protein